MLKRILGLSLILLLAGCATQSGGDYTGTVVKWRGGNVNQLVQKWGQPDQKITGPNGNTAYVYKKEGYGNFGGQYSPSVGVSFNSNGAPIFVTTPNTNPWSRTMSLNCITVFVANAQGEIIKTMSQGNGCSGSFNLAGKAP